MTDFKVTHKIYVYIIGFLLLIPIIITYAQSEDSNPILIALSFDDAPTGRGFMFNGYERTERLINHLKDSNIPQVVFFCTTEKFDYHNGRDQIEKYSKAGHVIANHSHSHNRPEDFGVTAYVADIEQAHDSLKNFATFRPWYRYPLLDEGKTIPVRDSIREALNALGYQNGYVTIDTWDWYIDRKCRNAVKEGMEIDTVALSKVYIESLWGAIQFYDKMALEILGYSPPHILLLHENDLAALYIDDLVLFLRRKGLDFITPDEAYDSQLAKQIPDVIFNNQGRITALAVEQGYEGPLRHESESPAYLDSLFEAYNVIADPE